MKQFYGGMLRPRQGVSVIFTDEPTLDDLKLLIKILNFSGENAFGKEEWKKPWTHKSRRAKA